MNDELLDLLYRLAAVLDAWRLGRDRTVGSGLTRSASALGVTAVALVLVMSHIAVAQPILVARDIIVSTFDGEGGDTSPLPDVDTLSDDIRDLIGLQATYFLSAALGLLGVPFILMLPKK